MAPVTSTRSSLFDCFDAGDICLYGRNAKRIDGSSCFGSCFIYWLLSECGLCCLVHMSKRQALRQRFGLREDGDDCLVTTFCSSCVVCQEARELRFHSNSSSSVVVLQPKTIRMDQKFAPEETIK
ncbi:hypothetical protein I4U23_004371 [Adineta vaga]|nr:hypothetical protein I4U23_004371 [Adineta vaga]